MPLAPSAIQPGHCHVDDDAHSRVLSHVSPQLLPNPLSEGISYSHVADIPYIARADQDGELQQECFSLAAYVYSPVLTGCTRSAILDL